MRFETFSSLKTEDEAVEFFEKHFPDALALVGEYVYCVCASLRYVEQFPIKNVADITSVYELF